MCLGLFGGGYFIFGLGFALGIFGNLDPFCWRVCIGCLGRFVGGPF